MVCTKSDVKVKINEFIAQQQAPFKTRDVVEYLGTLTGAVRLSPNRIGKYIQGSSKADYQVSTKSWYKRG